MDWIYQPISLPNSVIMQSAKERQLQLTKPPGSLGMLEDIACRLSSMQNTITPSLDKVFISVFAADHGIVEENISSFPQSVTAEMVKNFAAGGAAINVLAKQINASLEIVDTGIKLPPDDLENMISARAGNGTCNFLHGPAMSENQLKSSLSAGRAAVERALEHQAHLFIGGEMGIGNTTSATTLASALTGIAVSNLTGAGTGLDEEGIKHKTEIIDKALRKHIQFLQDPLAILQYLGGFEIAALVGAYIAAAHHRLPVLIDGFIASVASLIACKINKQALSWFFYAHRSHEKGHQCVLDYLETRPILDLDMRLGEGSGAALAVPVMRASCLLQNNMATFAEARVSDKLIR